MNGIDGISPAPTPKVGIEFMIGLMLLMLNTAARTKISRKHANPKKSGCTSVPYPMKILVKSVDYATFFRNRSAAVSDARDARQARRYVTRHVTCGVTHAISDTDASSHVDRIAAPLQYRPSSSIVRSPGRSLACRGGDSAPARS
jgi:hypothetical protein